MIFTENSPAVSTDSLPVQQSPSSDAAHGGSVRLLQTGNTVKMELPENADWQKSSFCLDGRKLESREFTLEQGEQVLSFELFDSDGQLMESAEQLLISDHQAPLILVPSSVLWLADSAVLNWQVEEENPCIECALIDGSLQSSSVVQLQKGMKEVVLQASDAAGNYASKTLQIVSSVFTDESIQPGSLISLETGRLKLQAAAGFEDLVLQVQSEKGTYSQAMNQGEAELIVPEGTTAITLSHPGLLSPFSFQVRTVLKEQPSQQTPDAIEKEPEPVWKENPAAVLDISQPLGEAVPAFQKKPAAVVETLQTSSYSAVPEKADSANVKPKTDPLAALMRSPLGTLEQNRLNFREDLDLLKETDDLPGIRLTYTSMESGTVYDSLEEMESREVCPRIEIAAYAYQNVDEPVQTWKAASSQGKVTFSSGLSAEPVSYRLDAQGHLARQKLQSSEQTVSLCSNMSPLTGSSFMPGSSLRLYVEDPAGSLSLQIDGKRTDISLEEDEFGQPYLPLKVKRGSQNIQVVQNEAVIYEKEIQGANPVPAAGVSWVSGLAYGMFSFLRSRRFG